MRIETRRLNCCELVGQNRLVHGCSRGRAEHRQFMRRWNLIYRIWKVKWLVCGYVNISDSLHLVSYIVFFWDIVFKRARKQMQSLSASDSKTVIVVIDLFNVKAHPNVCIFIFSWQINLFFEYMCKRRRKKCIILFTYFVIQELNNHRL